MKHLILLSLSVHLFVIANAQNDTVIVYLDQNDKPCVESKARKYAIQHKENNRWKKVVFDLTDDKPVYGAYYSNAECTVFDGPYTAFNKEHKITQTGRYTNNKKSGVWRGYYSNGKLEDSAYYLDGFITGLALRWWQDGSVKDSLRFADNGNGSARCYWPDGTAKESGSFFAGKKDGLWTYRYKTGIKCQEVQYQADSAVSYTCYDETGAVQKKDCAFEREARFKGGEEGWNSYLRTKLSNVTLPRSLLEGRVEGTVFVIFVIDTDGGVTDVKTMKSLDADLDRIAVNIIKRSPKWEPAIQYNRPMKAYRKQPITFVKPQ